MKRQPSQGFYEESFGNENLCGPVCLVGLSFPLERIAGIKIQASAIQRMRILQATGLEVEGVRFKDYPALMREFLLALGFPEPHVSVYESGRTTREEWLGMLSGGRMAHSQPLIGVGLRISSGRQVMGHYLIVSAHDPIARRLILIDPRTPERETSVPYGFEGARIIFGRSALDDLKGDDNDRLFIDLGYLISF